jgi:hypothetical protein
MYTPNHIVAGMTADAIHRDRLARAARTRARSGRPAGRGSFASAGAGRRRLGRLAVATLLLALLAAGALTQSAAASSGAIISSSGTEPSMSSSRSIVA